MRLIGVAVCGALALVLALLPAASTAAGGHRTKVVCISPNTGKRVYRETPERCTFHKRGEPLAEAFFVRTKDDRWHVWRRSHARGKGKELAPMGGTESRLRIKLKNPVRKCGHRVFSRAHFFFPRTGNGSTMPLDVCA
jgi:hypothetical protein